MEVYICEECGCDKISITCPDWNKPKTYTYTCSACDHTWTEEVEGG